MRYADEQDIARTKVWTMQASWGGIQSYFIARVACLTNPSLCILVSVCVLGDESAEFVISHAGLWTPWWIDVGNKWVIFSLHCCCFNTRWCSPQKFDQKFLRVLFLIIRSRFLLLPDQLQSYLYLRTQLVKNGCTYCEKCWNLNMNFHWLTCKVV
jgi:hypothetical protein